jgi:dihydroflavonol-4-reductase
MNDAPHMGMIQPGSKILVTGGTGFVGSYIIKELVERGYQVKALWRSQKLPFYIPLSILDKVEWIQGDILDIPALEEAMENVGAVIHAAAIVSFDKKDRSLMYKTNVEGTTNVVNAAIEKKIKRLLYVSSVAALGRTAGGTQVDEEKKWTESKINTHYAISKMKAEIEVWRGIAEGLDAVIINPSTVLGFGDWHTSSCKIFKTYHDGFAWYTNGINGFVAVEDVAKAAVSLLESSISGERYIVNGDNWPFQKLFTAIAEGFGKKPPHRLATPFLGQVAWRVEKLKSFFIRNKPLLTKESARVGQSKTYFDNAKLLKTLPGFSFTTLDECIGNACKKYLGTINDGLH